MSFNVTLSNGTVVDRATLPPPPGKRSGEYQGVVDAIVEHYGRPTVSRKEIVAFLTSTYPTEAEKVYMRRIRWVTNARNKYRPGGPRTPYVLPLTSEELATLPQTAPAAPEPAPVAAPTDTAAAVA